MNKSTMRKRVNNLEKARRAAARSELQSPVADSKRFERMRAFTSSMGVSDSALRKAMVGEKDMSKVLSKLHITTPGQGASKDTKGFTGDGLYQEAPEPYNAGRYHLDDSDYPDSATRMRGDLTNDPASAVNDFRIEQEPTLFRPVMRRMDGTKQVKPSAFGMTSNRKQSVLQRMKSQDLGDRVRKIQSTQPRVVDEPYTFPDVDFDYDMLGAVQSSIANYKKKKGMFNVQDGGGVYSPISNQL
tara:strand:+ start:3115 stop:3843 length:729 start_codon:yes stop_codon:yes gene_type:complete